MSDADTINSLLGGLSPRNGAATAAPKKDEKAIGQDEFLTMLVAQLKNQDPLNPMQNEQFAVDLAQFSQLERLVSIDQKLGAQTDEVSSYAAYLGREVTLNSDKIGVENGDAGKVSLELINNAQNVEIELVDALGRVAHRIEAGNLERGRHELPLSGLPLNNGEYSLRVTGQNSSGEREPLRALPVVLVTGFVPGPTPALLAGEREISPADITRVNAAS